MRLRVWYTGNGGSIPTLSPHARTAGPDEASGSSGVFISLFAVEVQPFLGRHKPVLHIERVGGIGIEKYPLHITGCLHQFPEEGPPDPFSLIAGIHNHVVDVGDAVIVREETTKADQFVAVSRGDVNC